MKNVNIPLNDILCPACNQQVGIGHYQIGTPHGNDKGKVIAELTLIGANFSHNCVPPVKREGTFYPN